jgi:hypothetical protein
MTRPLPPLLATWMLRRLNTGLHSEAFEGDLLEAWHGGRSGAWYWRQALGAVRVRAGRALLSAIHVEVKAAEFIEDLVLWLGLGMAGCLQLCMYAGCLLCTKPLKDSNLGLFVGSTLFGGALLGAVAAVNSFRTRRPRRSCIPHLRADW